MSKVFISYRHDDSEADAGRLHDTLSAELGRQALYKDVENIAVGKNWKRAVREALADSAAVLFVIGPDWRLSPAIEFELELALASEVPVVPILVRKADLLELTSGLPPPLSEIGERRAVTLSHATWSRDSRDLIETLKQVLADPTRARVLVEPPDPQVLLNEDKWPSVSARDHLLSFAQDLAECLCDPDVRKRAEASYDRFHEEVVDEYRRRHNISPNLLEVVQAGLQRLSIEQYVKNLLAQCPSELAWASLVSTAASLGALIGDPSIGETAHNDFDAIEAEIIEIRASKGDGGDPEVIYSSRAHLRDIVRNARMRLIEENPGIDSPGFTKLCPNRTWPIEAFGKTKQYGRRR